jgi:hypothetical protein
VRGLGGVELQMLEGGTGGGKRGLE